MKTLFNYVFVISILFAGCSLPDPELEEIKELIESFVAAIDRGDESLGRACLLDESGFRLLNPNVDERTDGEEFTEVYLAELIYNFRTIVDKYNGRNVEFADFIIGDIWTQHKGRRAFENSRIKIIVDGSTVELPLKGIAKIEDKWKIIDLSGLEVN